MYADPAAFPTTPGFATAKARCRQASRFPCQAAQEGVDARAGKGRREVNITTQRAARNRMVVQGQKSVRAAYIKRY